MEFKTKMILFAFAFLIVLSLGVHYQVAPAVVLYQAIGNAVFGVFGLWVAWRIVRGVLK